jgi:hypothetical protein
MIERLKNLYKLSEYQPVTKDGEVVLESDAKPKGKAQIVEDEVTLLDYFEEDDKTY